ncbi:MAG: hypothetical protein JNL69_02410 [Bacteroidia bacterium]|nr:hypothetical protein [Bacteroidia bacterium]
MDKNKIRKEIAELINSIKQHSDDIGDKKHIPQLELELILKKIASLYEKSIVFNYLNSQKSIENEIAKLIEPVVNIEEKIMLEISKSKEEPVVQKKAEAEIQEISTTIIEEPKEELKTIEGPVQQANTNTKPTVNIQKPSIADIKSAIGINDRFQFSNELFQGNMQEYEIGIQQLNSSENIDSAMVYFNSLKKLYNWDMKNETVIRLLELVERRYS